VMSSWRMYRIDVRWMVQVTAKRTMRSPADRAERREPLPESAQLVTMTTGWPAPPSVTEPNPSVLGDGFGVVVGDGEALGVEVGVGEGDGVVVGGVVLGVGDGVKTGESDGVAEALGVGDGVTSGAFPPTIVTLTPSGM
jgi:hypothetical protein